MARATLLLAALGVAVPAAHAAPRNLLARAEGGGGRELSSFWTTLFNVPAPLPSPPPGGWLVGNIPVSYFQDYQGLNVPNAPYSLSFSTATVYNDGTQYLVGHMAQPTETLNTFSIPITGGAGPCPNGAMRSGRLVVTCSAASTSFSVVESPMCSYAMFYQTTQQCPPGTLFAVPPPSPPPPSPSPTPPPPPAPAYLEGKVLVSYFSDYQGMNVPNQPYTMLFSKGTVYNGGTQYLIGHMASASETYNTFNIPITGGAGPCPNGAMRSGQLSVTCSAAGTTFSVIESPMCTYDMYYSTTQACPPGTVFPSPPPPPPTVYASTHVLDQGASHGFSGKVIAGPTQHVLNGGATTTSSETVASGKHNVYETTTTTDVTQEGTGNGHMLSKSSSTTSTTSTEHQQTFDKVNVHASTTDLPATPATAKEAPTAAPLCGGATFSIADAHKTLCLHVKGGVGADGFTVAAAKRPVITAACKPGSPNQGFSYLPASEGGMIMHDASQLVLSLQSATVSNGAGIFLAPEMDLPTQEWMWADATTGGTIAAVADPNFELTDARVNSGAAVGLPVHMWHLAQSLPAGAPNAQWVAQCPKQ